MIVKILWICCHLGISVQLIVLERFSQIPGALDFEDSSGEEGDVGRHDEQQRQVEEQKRGQVLVRMEEAGPETIWSNSLETIVTQIVLPGRFGAYETF